MSPVRPSAVAIFLSLSLIPTGGRADQPATPSAALELADQADAKMRSGEWNQAAKLWRQVVASNPVVGSYWGRLGRACYQAKDYRNSIQAYEKALELRDGFPWAAAYDIACCHALLGEKEQALTWLDKSFVLGFRSLEDVRKDEDLKSLRDDSRFRKLAAVVDIDKLSRTEAWRFDIELLVRELKRLQYNFTRGRVPPEFDSLARQLTNDVLSLTDHQLEVGLMKLVRMAGDGHTVVKPSYTMRDRRKAIGVQFYQFEEGLFITEAAPQHKAIVGAQVIKIGGHTVDHVQKTLDPLISRDNEIWPKFIGPELMRQPQVLQGLGLLPEDDKVTLTLRNDKGEETVITLQVDAGQPAGDWISARNRTTGSEPVYQKNRKAPYWFEYLPEAKAVFMQYNEVRDDPKEPLKRFCDRLFEFIAKNDVNRLVIDMRFNGGGNNFLNRPLVEGLMRCDKINRRGKLFVLIGRNTFSAAQCGVTQIERHTNALFAGEPTGSCPNFVGETILLRLPYSKMTASISDLYWQNSVAMDYRTWLAPQIYVPPTFAAYRSNQDPVLDAVLTYGSKRGS